MILIYRVTGGGTPVRTGKQSSPPKGRQHILLILLQRIFLISAHKIDIELSYSGASQPANLFNVSFGGTKQAKPISYFIGDKVAIAAVNFAMMKIIVFSAVAYIRGQRR